jgi:tetratricopeptide (TPR) repeat protein
MILDQIDEAIQQGELDKAGELLRSMSKGLEPPADLAPADRGRFLQFVGDWAYSSDADINIAVNAFRQLVDYERTSGESATGRAFTFNRLAYSLVKAEEYDQAEAAFGEAVALFGELEPTYRASIYFAYGQALYFQARYVPAASALRLAFAEAATEGPDVRAGIQLFLAMSLKPLVQVKELAERANALEKQTAAMGHGNAELAAISKKLMQVAGDAKALRAECEAAYEQAIAVLAETPGNESAVERARNELAELRKS